MIDDNTRTYIVELLVDFWRDQKPEDTTTLNACWQLADKILASLSANSAKRVQHSPRKYRDTIAAELDRLTQHDLIARSLVGTLVTGASQSAASPVGTELRVAIHGDQNQIAFSHQSGPVTQVMYVPGVAASSARKSEPSTQAETQAPFIRLQLTQHTSSHMEVRALETPTMGQAREETTLPYTDDDLIAVLKAIAAERIDAGRFTAPQIEALKRLGLLNEHPYDRRRLLRLVGQRLYEVLFVGTIGEALRATLNQPRPSGMAIHLQLCFDADNVPLARYPWEVLHDDSHHLVQGRIVELTRYITYPKAIPSLSFSRPSHVLYVAPRPRSLPYLPADEDLGHMHTALGDLEQTRQIQIDRLSPPTFQALITYLSNHTTHILHFDGHGTFVRQCPHCQARNYPHMVTCADCHTSLATISPEGFLAFENAHQEVSWVDSATLGSVLNNRSLHIAVVLACSSGIVRGDTLFTGIGPALIRAGVPAVIATQADIESASATLFTQGFYRQLAQGAAIATAVNAGRELLLPERTWYLPVLYVRNRS